MEISLNVFADKNDLIKNTVSLSLNQFFASFSNFILKERAEATPELVKSLKAFADLLEEYFTHLEEKAHNLLTESLILKERLILKLVFTVLNTLGENIRSIKELDVVFAKSLYSLCQTKFKLINSSVSLVDCCLIRSLSLHSVLLFDHDIFEIRYFAERVRNLSTVQLQAIHRTALAVLLHPAVLRQCRRATARLQLSHCPLTRCITCWSHSTTKLRSLLSGSRSPLISSLLSRSSTSRVLTRTSSIVV